MKSGQESEIAIRQTKILLPGDYVVKPTDIDLYIQVYKAGE